EEVQQPGKATFRLAGALGDRLEPAVCGGKPGDDPARFGELRLAQQDGGGGFQRKPNIQHPIDFPPQAPNLSAPQKSMILNTAALSKAAPEARGLAMDAVHACASGHLGLPLGCAEIGAVLFGPSLRYNPAEPKWLNRDRFVLSAGHGSMFLYSWL